jgi:uncharacterized protein DUF4384
MLMMTALLKRLCVCAVMAISAQQVFAAVRILEGSAPQPSRAEQPAPSAPRQEPQLSSPSPAPTVPPGNTQNTQTGSGSTSDTRLSASPNSPTALNGIAPARIENPAELSLQMLPGYAVSVGNRVAFRVATKKAGYVLLFDVDSTGRLTQIYPNTASLLRSTRPNGNYIKPGGTLTIPLATDPYSGVEYVVSPPTGQAMIIAILSAQPVQIVDLPDLPPEVKSQSDALAFLAKWTNELRIPDDVSGELRQATFSFDAKSYNIQ